MHGISALCDLKCRLLGLDRVDLASRTTSHVPGIPHIPSKALDQYSSVDFECSGDLQDVDEARVDFAPFQVPDIGSMEPRKLTKVLLAQIPLQPLGPDPIPKCPQLSGAPARFLHPGIGRLVH